MSLSFQWLFVSKVPKYGSVVWAVEWLGQYLICHRLPFPLLSEHEDLTEIFKKIWRKFMDELLNYCSHWLLHQLPLDFVWQWDSILCSFNFFRVEEGLQMRLLWDRKQSGHPVWYNQSQWLNKWRTCLQCVRDYGFEPGWERCLKDEGGTSTSLSVRRKLVFPYGSYDVSSTSKNSFYVKNIFRSEKCPDEAVFARQESISSHGRFYTLCSPVKIEKRGLSIEDLSHSSRGPWRHEHPVRPCTPILPCKQPRSWYIGVKYQNT